MNTYNAVIIGTAIKIARKIFLLFANRINSQLILAHGVYAQNKIDLLLWFLDLLTDNGHAGPAIVCPESIVKCQCNMARFHCRSFKAAAQIGRMTDRDLVDASENYD